MIVLNTLTIVGNLNIIERIKIVKMDSALEVDDLLFKYLISYKS